MYISVETLIKITLLYIMWRCRVCCAESAKHTTHTPFQDMLPHLHIIYNDAILISFLTEI